MREYVKKQRRKKRIEKLRAHDDRPEVLKKRTHRKIFFSALEGSFGIWLKKDGWAVIGIIVLLLFSGWYFMLKNERFTILDVTVEGAEFLSADKVRDVVFSEMEGAMWGIFSKNNYWVVRSKKIQSRLERQFGETFALDSVDVQKKFPSSIFITLDERVPSVAWVTKDGDKEFFYTIDREGYVTQIVDAFDQVNGAFPRVRDDNRFQLGLGWQIISPEYIDFLFSLDDSFQLNTGLSVDSYIFPKTLCQEREYVAEEIFEQEILESESEEFRNRKIEVQEQFQSGVLTIDESIDALEKVKQDELSKLGKDPTGANGRIEWETVFVEVECDFVVVGTDLQVVVKDDDNQFLVYFDTREDLAVQIENLVSVLNTRLQDRSNLSYIDVRISDRVYYK